jgi:hypothetical protein
MQRFIKWTICGAMLVLGAACSGDSGGVPTSAEANAEVSAGGGTTEGVATVQVLPKPLTISKGYYSVMRAIALDANGARIAGKRASWKSSNPAVVAASDTGVMYGKEVGTAKVYGTIDGKTDSSTVTVVAAPPPPPPPPPTQPELPPVVASFDLTVRVAGTVAGTDTIPTAPVAGATVKLTRIGGINGDTLAVGIAAGSAVTDQTGVAKFKALAGGTYSVEVIPAAGSSYKPGVTRLAPPRSSDVQVFVGLR